MKTVTKKFRTQYHSDIAPGITITDKSIAETAGYISVRQQIENMILAGERLRKYREETYDFNGQFPGDEFDYDDPTRAPGYDIADAWQEQHAINERKKDRMMKKRAHDKAAKALKDSLAKQAAETAEASKVSADSKAPPGDAPPAAK